MPKKAKLMYTKKSYQDTAQILKDAAKRANGSAEKMAIVDFIAQQFVELYANDNPNFDPQKFLNAIFK